MRTPPEVVREASVIMKKGFVWSGKDKTGCFRNASLIFAKAILWSMDHCQWAFL